MQKYTIKETFTLPSKGKMYTNLENPSISLRSMTTREEMKRLAPTDTPYKAMSEIIEECIIGDKPSVGVYNLFIGDYEFLLQKLRVVTYGPEYKMTVQCPYCGEVTETVTDLDTLETKEFKEEVMELLKVQLPISGKSVELNIQTPRMLDEIAQDVKDIKKRHKNSYINPELRVTLQHLIKKVDGNTIMPSELEMFVLDLPMKDVTTILNRLKDFNAKVGPGSLLEVKCDQCGEEFLTTFRYTPEFFGPTEIE